MESPFKEFIEKVNRLGVCNEYADKVERAKSKKSYIDIALSGGALPWISDAVCKGHLKPETVRKEFAPFNNGKYVRDMDGYTSTLWCYPDHASIKIDSTTALVICHDGEIVIDRPICELYLIHSDVVIKGQGITKVHLYNSMVVNPDTNVIVESKYEYEHADVPASDTI